MVTSMMPDVEIVREPARAAALLDPERRRLLEILAESPDSASGLARRLGDTRQRVNYHLRALEDAGLVRLREERRKGNCYERVMQVAAQRFVIDPGVLGGLGAEPVDAGDRFSATYLVALAARAIREVAGVLARAAGQRQRVATLSIETEVRLAHPDTFQAMARELSEVVAKVVARYHDEGAGAGRTFRLVSAVYPRPVAQTDHEVGGGAG